MKICQALMLVLFVFFLFLSPAIGKTIRVPADSATIQAGFSGASYGDTVLVALGIYSAATDGETFPIVMKNGVALLSESGSEYTWIQANYDTTVIYCSNVDSNTIIHGFKISKGQAAKGGGIYCENSSIRIIENEISNNKAVDGAGIYCQGENSSVRIVGNKITGNESTTYAGGIYCKGGSYSIIDNQVLENKALGWNRPIYAGGIYCTNASCLILGNTIKANNVWVGHVGPKGYGGGILCESSSVEITDNLIEGNYIWGTYNKCIYAAGYGAGISCWQCSPLYISNNIIRGNYFQLPASTGYGGGIYCNGSLAPKIVGNTVSNNGYVPTSGGESVYGGGIYLVNTSLPTTKKNILINNVASYGGGMYIQDSFVDSLNNNTIDSNYNDGITSYNSRLEIFHNIVTNSKGGYGIKDAYNSTLEIYHNDVWNNTGGNFLNCPAGIGDTTWGVNYNGTSCDGYYNIIRDPLFSASPDSLYYLQGQSPCIDAGNPSSPKDPDSTLADLGVYYYLQYLRGDANRDEQVSLSDIVYIISYVFKGGPPPIPLEAGDTNCDGEVTVSDAVYLINYLFKHGPSPEC